MLTTMAQHSKILNQIILSDYPLTKAFPFFVPLLFRELSLKPSFFLCKFYSSVVKNRLNSEEVVCHKNK